MLALFTSTQDMNCNIFEKLIISTNDAENNLLHHLTHQPALYCVAIHKVCYYFKECCQGKLCLFSIQCLCIITFCRSIQFSIPFYRMRSVLSNPIRRIRMLFLRGKMLGSSSVDLVILCVSLILQCPSFYARRGRMR